MVVVIAIAILVLILFIMYSSYIKKLRYGNLSLVTGGVKMGKTQLSVIMVFTQYKKQLWKWRFRCLKAWMKRKPKPEKPLIYSNMPIGRANKDYYVPLTLKLLKREERFRYGSVIYFNEVSLLAGSKDIRDEEINDNLLQLFKLCAHETQGGYFILDTQSPMDCHYTAKRSLSTYYNIIRRSNYFFNTFSILWIREQILVDGEHSDTVDNTDPDDAKHDGNKPLYALFVFNRKWWKRYDQYAYSVLTDHLPVADNLVKVTKNKKISGLVRLKKG